MKKIIILLVIGCFVSCKQISKKISVDDFPTENDLLNKNDSVKLIDNEQSFFKIKHKEDSLELIDFTQKILDSLKVNQIYKKVNLICEGEQEYYTSKCINKEYGVSISYAELKYINDSLPMGNILINYKNKDFIFPYGVDNDYGSEFLFFVGKKTKIVIVKKLLENIDAFYVYWVDDNNVIFLGNEAGIFKGEDGIDDMLNIFEKGDSLCLLITTSYGGSIILKFNKS